MCAVMRPDSSRPPTAARASTAHPAGIARPAPFAARPAGDRPGCARQATRILLLLWRQLAFPDGSCRLFKRHRTARFTGSAPREERLQLDAAKSTKRTLPCAHRRYTARLNGARRMSSDRSRAPPPRLCTGHRSPRSVSAAAHGRPATAAPAPALGTPSEARGVAMFRERWCRRVRGGEKSAVDKLGRAFHHYVADHQEQHVDTIPVEWFNVADDLMGRLLKQRAAS
jgi:hypothetical protein